MKNTLLAFLTLSLLSFLTATVALLFFCASVLPAPDPAQAVADKVVAEPSRFVVVCEWDNLNKVYIVHDTHTGKVYIGLEHVPLTEVQP